MIRTNKAALIRRTAWLLCIMILLTTGIVTAQVVKIMPLGNSLTAGLTEAGSDPVGGYRDDLFQMLTAEGVQVDFVGSQQNGTGFDADHEGHPQWTVEELNAQLDGWLATHQPNIVLFMGGTNDVFNQQKTSAQIVGSIQQTVEKIYAFNPNTKIVLSSVIPRRDGLNDFTIEVNAELMKLYYDKMHVGYKIYYAGHFEMFTANPNWAADYMNQLDLIHASNAGYEVMAKMYFNCIMNAINPSDPIVTDNFNRSQLGFVWDAATNYSIVSGELANTATDEYWNYLATYKAISDPSQVSIKLSKNADQAEMQYWGVGALLDAPTRTAGGYFIRLVTNNIQLWTIANGKVNSEVGSAPSGGATINPGDVFKVAITTDGTGHHFDCYINDDYIGRISDPEKKKGNTKPAYAGIFFRGNQTSKVNEFNLFKSTDTTPPDPIIDLGVGSVTANTIQLTWTATGDDGASGNASGYDMRFSKSFLTESNFAQAEKVLDAPVPSAPGTFESHIVAGLDANTEYFFAIKTYDEAGNMSIISNIISASTSSALGLTDDFERDTLGSVWVTHPAFKITQGALDNTSAEESFNHLAIFKGRNNPIEVSLVWDDLADVTGIGQGGVALMMDAASTTANGYFAWRRTNLQKIMLWQIINGEVAEPVGGGLYDALLPTPPQPGDTWKVAIRSDEAGNHFDFYINNIYDGSISDLGKVQGNTDIKYAGIVLHGNRNNNVESFTVVNTVGEAANIVEVSGNNQEGAVGRPLPFPLVVKVTDKDGMPVSGYKLEYFIVGGGGHFDKNVATDGNIRIEAEASKLTGMFAEQDAECAGGLYITGGNAGPRQASVTFTFFIETEGDYFIWGRVNPKGNYQQNSWYWKYDGSQERIWDSRPIDGKIWYWDSIGSRGESDQERNPDEEYWTFHFTRGEHTLTLVQFDRNTKIDKLYITSGLRDVPEDKEEFEEYRTDGNGEAHAIWTLGNKFGVENNRAAAKAPGLKGSPIQFVASALGDIPDKMSYISGNNQSGPGGETLPESLVVRVTDQYGNPNKNHPVTFTVTHGGGKMVSPQPVLTDANGYAGDKVIMGTEDYNTIVEAVSSIDGNPLTNSPVVFQATATSKIAHEMKYIRGNSQIDTVTAVLPIPLEVQIFDSLKNPIANHSVRFRVVYGTAKVGDGQTEVISSSNANGKASAIVTLGTTADSNLIEVAGMKMGKHLIGSPDTLVVYSKPLSAAKVAYHSGNNQTGAAGNVLAAPLRVKVMDKYDNPVTGHNITFKVTGGGASIEGAPSKTVPSDGRGLAFITLTLGADEREKNKCEASGVRTDNGQPLEGSPVKFEATPGKVSKMQIQGEVTQEGSAGYLLEEPFVIRILDNYNNPVPGFGVEFNVEKGGGTINGATDTTILTDSEGKAYCYYTMGYEPGLINKIVAEAYNYGVPLEGSPKYFQVTAYNASDYQYENGSGPKQFSGTTGVPLPDSIKTKVIDTKGRSMKYFPVTYKIIAGNGKINGKDSIQVLTNAAGFACTQWTLGPLPGSLNNIMRGYAEFNGVPLTHSPREFKATAKKGDPSLMVIFAQSDSQAAVVGGVLEKPIRVRITDMAANPILGHPVFFKITGGNGKINDAVKENTFYTDSDGYAQVNWRIGNDKGWVNTMEVTSKFNEKHLQGSPHTFAAYGLESGAESLARKSPERINGKVGQALPQPFLVQVSDRFGNGVAGMSVQFAVTQGGGKLDGDTLTQKVVVSDENGICGITLTLGPTVGVDNIVKATAFNGAIALKNSPMYFYSQGQAGDADVDASRIVCEPDKLAAGETTTVTVILTDPFGNPPGGKYWVTLHAEGDGARILQQPAGQTDEQGRALGTVTSQKSGVKWISAEILFSSGRQWLTNKGKVEFLPLVASGIGAKSGDSQTGNVNASLPAPLGITVFDKFNNPVQGWEVTFTAGEGGCHIFEPQPVFTDSTGQARSHLILGPNPGRNTASVVAKDINQTLSFTANAVEGTARYLTIASGDRQKGTAGILLPEPLVVKVTDVNGRPVFNHTVRFSVEFGDGSFGGAPSILIPTDPLGLASAHYTLGKQIGPNFVRVISPELYPLYGEFVKFSIDGTSGVAKVLQKITPDGASASIYQKPPALQVRTTDFYSNGVGDVEVTYRIVSGEATIDQAQPVISNSEGYASSKITFGGTVGPVEVEAAAEGLVNSPIKFITQATAANATTLQKAAGDSQSGTIGRKLPFPFEVLVKDNYGNPVKGTPVYWTVKEGNGTLLLGGSNSTTYSEDDGIARNYLQLGQQPGYNEVIAFNGNITTIQLFFGAQGVTNKFPVIKTIGEKTVDEKQSLSFTVEASDEDGDSYWFGAKAGTIPAGATFDSTGSRQFSWVPNYTQAGEYKVWFLVHDNRGGIGAEEVKITVNNINRKPQWTSRWPISPDISADRLTGEPVDFVVEASDPDVDDVLKYQWHLKNRNLVNPDSLLVSTTKEFKFLPKEYGAGPIEVSVTLSDGYDFLRLVWHLSNKDAVELAHFSANMLEYQGVQLSWETSYENNNMGFYILRSSSRNGEYRSLTPHIIPANKEMKYEFLDKTARAGRVYFYRLEDVEYSGKKNLHPPIKIQVEQPTSFQLSQNYPNPFNPLTRIQYQLPEAGEVKLVIYNIRGQMVRTLVQERQMAGYYFVTWDGCDDAGQVLASGIYFYHLQTPRFQQTKRMVLLK